MEDGVIKIIFIKSEDNDSDILTKNLKSPKLHSEQAKKFMTEK